MSQESVRIVAATLTAAIMDKTKLPTNTDVAREYFRLYTQMLKHCQRILDPAEQSELTSHRRASVAMLSTLPKHGVCAEVGVFTGGLSRIIVKMFRPTSLYLIDPWQWRTQWFSKHSESELAEIAQGENTAGGDKIYELVRKMFATVPEVKVLRTTSILGSRAFSDNYFDWVFIDGDHRYEPVVEDLKHWWPKIKLGGHLCGDDYSRAPDRDRGDKHEAINGVHFAVDEFVAAGRFKFETFPRDDGDHRAAFKIQKPAA